ncbi:MAG: DUF488 domain-containing protein [Balneolaceae bacterium]
MLRTKRVYEEPEESDGYRILTERLWPRGVSKERAKVDQWLKSISPSNDLRKWFNHDPDKWEEFKDRYRKELYGSEAVSELLEIIQQNENVTLVFASKDEEHNSTMVLKDFLERFLT